MNKQQQIQFFKRQVKTAAELMQVAQQNYEAAARIESEAKSALEVLGAPKERARKGKLELTDAQKIKLLGSLTQ